MRYPGVLLLALAPAAIAEDVPAAYRRELARIARAERVFWDGYQQRANEAEQVLRRPWSDPPPGVATGARYGPVCDHSAYRRLYAEYAAIQESRGTADLALARSGHPGATSTLFDALMDLADDIDAAETEVFKGNPAGGWGAFLQRTAIRCHGLAAREASLVRALGSASGAAAFLVTEGFARATRADGSRSIIRSVAVLDALGVSADPSARPLLESTLGSQKIHLRIAALEALSCFGPDVVGVLTPLFEDPSPIVRRALLDAIRARPAAGWIAPVLKTYVGAQGQLRVDAITALHALTRQRFGDDPEAWQAWHERNRATIEAGAFDAAAAPVEEAGTRPARAAITFYGVSSPSLSVILALDGTENLLLPVDCDLQTTRHACDWPFGKQDWRDKHQSHESLQLAELGKCLDGMPEGASFGMLMVKESAGLKTLPLKAATPAHRKAAVRFLESHAPRGWRSEFENLVTAMDMAGLAPLALPDRASPVADTVFLVCDGSCRAGRYVVPEAATAAFARLNRFRRLTVHVIQTCEVGAYSEAFLKQLASMTGGTHVRIRKPPG